MADTRKLTELTVDEFMALNKVDQSAAFAALAEALMPETPPEPTPIISPLFKKAGELIFIVDQKVRERYGTDKEIMTAFWKDPETKMPARY